MTDGLSEEETDETKESKSDFERRLKSQGLHDEATKYRTERRIQYHASGLTRKESREKAWDDARLKFPPPDVEPAELPDIEMPVHEPEPEEELVHIPGIEGSMDVARDVEWAYEHIGDEKIRADQAPSGGAWSMLEYGRSARHKFLELMTKYDLSAKRDDDESETFQADASDHIDAIQKLMAITEQVHEDVIRDALRQCPDVVVAEMR
jgi:hypothetical protein